ncbi:flavodoxin [Sporolactobacillus sp. CPB3-1]|uniref:Flavodoxin n=1 Tax=Sporolactobacillus mangiferae TaxID=2940498 RepID=A0ABT0M668_9BACL|nr:flavodoxin [Sporolactobacillus mangiferae]MCL1630359.1 flavodoxin [Sporolactobacillus mangiferae]
MQKILIIYASETGNTEEMAARIAEGVQKAGIKPAVQAVDQISIDELMKYDGLMFGSYTDGMGDLPYIVEDLLDELNGHDLTGKAAMCFGSGDSSYGLFAAAVDTIQESFVRYGAEIIEDAFKVELSMTEEESNQAMHIGESFARKLMNRA